MFTIVNLQLYTFVFYKCAMTIKKLTTLHKTHKEKSLFGRYITNKHIEGILKRLGVKFQKSIIGFSVEKRPIHSLEIGTGKIKILVWSQMHGNESTTTKALFDLFNVIDSSDEFDDILKLCKLQIIPILNPDGAKRYTRLNANEIDLNRDAQDLSQPESVVLRSVFNQFKPNYCLNLHGQRTIFGAGNSGEIATLSFLSPAEDENRSVTEARKKGMTVIAAINDIMQEELPNAIGRYDDGFNINCVGDTFQSLKIPTILYEAGHYDEDYDREIVRAHVFKSIFAGIKSISEDVDVKHYEDYFKIPENKKNFYDVIVRDVKLRSNEGDLVDVAFQFKETLVDGVVKFVPFVENIGNLNKYFAHKEIKGNGSVIKNHNYELLKLDIEIVFVMLGNIKTLIKS